MSKRSRILAVAGLLSSVWLRADAAPPGFSIVPVVTDLSRPLAFAFLPDRRMVVAERDGRVLLVSADGLTRKLIASVNAAAEAERGLLGIAVDPAFDTAGWIYLYYTDAAQPRNRVVRFRLDGDAARGGMAVVLDDIPAVSGIHNAGDLRFGQDGKLYVATGENARGAWAQELDTVAGKILRLNPDGSVPADNPFAGIAGRRGEIWHYGLRNPFRFSFDEAGRMYIGDVGESAWEEISVAEPGQKGLNFGWPCREGRHEGIFAHPGCATGTVDPIYEYSHSGYVETSSASVTGGAVAGRDVYPAPYAGALFFGDAVRNLITVMQPSGAVLPFETDRATPVQFVTGPDSRIYYVSMYGSAIYKIVHASFPDVVLPDLTATAALAPTSIDPGGTVLLTVAVQPTDATHVIAQADLSAIGGRADELLVDDGTRGDVTPLDGTYSARIAVPATAALGTVNVHVVVRDGLDREAHATAALTIVAAVDSDGDGLTDRCEQTFGLNASSNLEPFSAGGDFDNDGLSNLDECRASSHPRGFFRRYFAEGATGPFFTTRFAMTNSRLLSPGQTGNAATAHVQLRFLRSDGTVVTHVVNVTPQRQAVVDVGDVPGMATAEFATVIESDYEVAVERTMTWDRQGYGAHAESEVDAPALTWHFAEGATHSGFNLFYLLQNANDAPADVTVTYLRPAGQDPITRQHTVAGRSRLTIWVNQEGQELAAADVSATIVSTLPIVVERAMYLDARGQFFGAGHVAAGVTRPSANWFFAEGATGAYFDLYLLVSNPASTPAHVRASYLLPAGQPVEREFVIAPMSRHTIYVNAEDSRLADTAVSVVLTVTNGVDVIAERAMWWPGGGPQQWHEAHSAHGATTASTSWSVAGGQVDAPTPSDTYLLISNTEDRQGEAVVTLLSSGAPLQKTFTLLPRSRTNVDVRVEFPAAVGLEFGALVESAGSDPVALVVELATYWSADGVPWSAGANALGTPAQVADATLTVGPGGITPAAVTIPAGGRVRVVNADTKDRWIASGPHGVPASAYHFECTAMEPVGRLRPGGSSLSGPFTTPQVCELHDHLNFGTASATVTVQ